MSQSLSSSAMDNSPHQLLDSTTSDTSSIDMDVQSTCDIVESTHPSDLYVIPIHWLAKLKRLWLWLGPTWLISCTLLDPGAIEGSLEQGAFTGYQLIWVTWWATVMVFLFQTIAGHIGIITGKSLAQLINQSPQYQHNTAVKYFIWIAVEVSVVGDDFQAVVGSVLALQLLFNIPFYAAVLLTCATTFVLTYLYYRAASKLESVVGVMLFAMFICYLVNVVQSHAPAGKVLYGWVVPTTSSYGVLQLVGSIGGIVTPNALFLGSALVLNRPVDHRSPQSVQSCIKYSTTEMSIGMIMSFLCNLFVIITFASSFYSPTCAVQQLAYVNGQCNDIGLDDAPDSLQQLYGTAAKYLFALALFCAAQNSMISATLAGQATFDG